MIALLVVILLSAGIGYACGKKLSGVKGAIAAVAIPWLSLLAVLLFDEYVLPYRGGGASMWPIAQLFAGTLAAIVGGATYSIVRNRQTKEKCYDHPGTD